MWLCICSQIRNRPFQKYRDCEEATGACDNPAATFRHHLPLNRGTSSSRNLGRLTSVMALSIRTSCRDYRAGLTIVAESSERDEER